MSANGGKVCCSGPAIDNTFMPIVYRRLAAGRRPQEIVIQKTWTIWKTPMIVSRKGTFSST